MNVLMLATANRHKAEELRSLFRGAWFRGVAMRVETLEDHPDLAKSMPPEDGETFADNARLKAEHVAKILKRPVLGDDSGLCVDALNGGPGVRSHRYAPGDDRDRVQAILRALCLTPDRERKACFVCAMAFSIPGEPTVLVEGRVEGRIARAPRGTAGFGYDPVFEIEGARTMAELSQDEKNALSHRGRALALLRPHLVQHFSLVQGDTIP